MMGVCLELDQLKREPLINHDPCTFHPSQKQAGQARSNATCGGSCLYMRPPFTSTWRPSSKQFQDTNHDFPE